MSWMVQKKTSTCGSQVGHMWVTSGLFCRSVSQMGEQVRSTFNSGVHLNLYEKAGVEAGWLLHHDQYLRQYYGECYNRDFHLEN